MTVLVSSRIRLGGEFGAFDGRKPLIEKLLQGGASREAIHKFLGDKLEFVADIEIDSDGVTTIRSIERRGPCPSRSKRGYVCCLKELHTTQHASTYSPSPGVVENYFWPNEGDLP